MVIAHDGQVDRPRSARNIADRGRAAAPRSGLRVALPGRRQTHLIAQQNRVPAQQLPPWWQACAPPARSHAII